MNHGLHGPFVSRRLDHHRPCIHISCTFDGRWAPGSLDGRVTARRRLPLWLLHLSGTQHGDAAGGIRYLAKNGEIDFGWDFGWANFRRSFRRHDGAPLQERYPNSILKSEDWVLQLPSTQLPCHFRSCLLQQLHCWVVPVFNRTTFIWLLHTILLHASGRCGWNRTLNGFVGTLQGRSHRSSRANLATLVWWCFICANLGRSAQWVDPMS